MFKHIQWLFLNRSDIVVCVLIAVFSDIDECGSSTSPCEGGKSCKNTVGSYECSCKQGFQWDGKACSGKHGVELCSVRDWQLFVSTKTDFIRLPSQNTGVVDPDPGSHNLKYLANSDVIQTANRIFEVKRFVIIKKH